MASIKFLGFLMSFMWSEAGSSQPVDETHVSLGFQQWLVSVTERIHQTMHYQFDGKTILEEIMILTDKGQSEIYHFFIL